MLGFSGRVIVSFMLGIPQGWIGFCLSCRQFVLARLRGPIPSPSRFALVARNQPEHLRQCVVENFCRMLRDAPCAVFDLVPAARARCSDDCVDRSRAHRRQEYESANLHRYVEMLLFITERTGHAAAS